ncbi:hypothetical protein [Lacinutrix himadriensis]|uniref:hypothetical protein n=1 Tax=Lacinutrix himadriensis TaxID=641549 RepID=UPI0006E1AFF2|nr:hypothetical protein [Lacinutrix himadriensis]
MEKQMHLAAQYLAAAGISFLEKKADDSHTNLGFNTENGCLSTHALSDDGDVLCLDYEKFALVWKSEKESITFLLDGVTHAEVLQWLSDTSKAFLDKKYQYTFHYDLPYNIDDTFTFQLEDAAKLKALMQLRVLAQCVLQEIDTKLNLNASIRIWPHHFDTGIYSPLPNSDITIGLGLAIPDNVSNTHYLYISGYQNGNKIDTDSFPKLASGAWKSNGFTGAILKADSLTVPEGVAFFEAAIQQLKTK